MKLTSKLFVSRCLQVVDMDAETIFKCESFTGVSGAMLAKILARDSLRASEMTVYDRTIAWAKAKLERFGGIHHF